MTDPIVAAEAASSRLEIAELFSRFREEFLRLHPQPMEHYSFIHLIESCRTAKLGGHIQRCGSCEYKKPMYNSCRTRLCPKCQSLKRERWVEARKQEILPCKYFHGVFTLPHSVNPIALSNKKLVYRLLFESVSETLQSFAMRELGGRLGFISVLHTWNQKLLDHIHLHCLIPAGALDMKTGAWIPCRSSSFLFPVFALSQVFRAKFLEKLKKIHGELRLPARIAYLRDRGAYQDFIDSMWKEEFVVYAKQPFRGAEQVIEYLGRYVHRTAISNHRLVKLEGDRVTFKYRDRKDGNQEKLTTVAVTEFLRRFMLHSLPKGLPRIRYHGYLANRSKKANVDRIYRALEVRRTLAELAQVTAREFILKRYGRDIARCPACERGTLYESRPIPKARSPCPIS